MANYSQGKRNLKSNQMHANIQEVAFPGASRDKKDEKLNEKLEKNSTLVTESCLLPVLLKSIRTYEGAEVGGHRYAVSCLLRGVGVEKQTEIEK